MIPSTRQVQGSGQPVIHGQSLALSCVWAPRSPLTCRVPPMVLPLFNSTKDGRDSGRCYLPSASLPVVPGHSFYPLWRLLSSCQAASPPTAHETSALQYPWAPPISSHEAIQDDSRQARCGCPFLENGTTLVCARQGCGHQ